MTCELRIFFMKQKNFFFPSDHGHFIEVENIQRASETDALINLLTMNVSDMPKKSHFQEEGRF